MYDTLNKHIENNYLSMFGKGFHLFSISDSTDSQHWTFLVHKLCPLPMAGAKLGYSSREVQGPKWVIWRN